MAELHLDLDPALPRRASLERALREAIRAGRLLPGHELPSTRVLASTLGLARGTVVDAYAQLVAEGWFHSRQGAATVVASTPVAEPPPARLIPPDRTRWDLRPGAPDTALFPATAWLAALRTVVRVTPSREYDYGDARGRPELRAALSSYLARARKVVCPAERIVVFSGFGQALSVLAAAFRSLGLGAMAVEDPFLDVQRRILDHAGMPLVPVPVDEQGMDTTLLGRTAARTALVAPAHQFPLGVTLSSARRTELVAWARRVDGFVVEDDYDAEYRFDRQPVGALHALDPSRVVYAGTASKTLAPGVRLAWLALPHRLLEAVDRQLVFQTVPTLDQLAMAELITSGRFDEHIRRTRAEYRRRRSWLVDRLDELPDWARLTGIAAGLHALLVLPGGLEQERELIAAARRRSMAVQGLGPHWQAEPRFGGLVLGYCRPPAHAARATMDQFVALLRDC